MFRFLLSVALVGLSFSAFAQSEPNPAELAAILEGQYAEAASESIYGARSQGALFAAGLEQIVKSKDFRKCTCTGACKIKWWKKTRQAACSRVVDRLALAAKNSENAYLKYNNEREAFDKRITALGPNEDLQFAAIKAQAYLDYHYERVANELREADAKHSRLHESLCANQHSGNAKFVKCFLKRKVDYLRGEFAHKAKERAPQIAFTAYHAARYLRDHLNLSPPPAGEQVSREIKVLDCRQTQLIDPAMALKVWIDPRTGKGVAKYWEALGLTIPDGGGPWDYDEVNTNARPTEEYEVVRASKNAFSGASVEITVDTSQTYSSGRYPTKLKEQHGGGKSRLLSCDLRAN